MTGPESSPHDAWNEMLDGLRTAGEQVAEQTAALDAAEQADGFRALARALANQLGRFEVDRDRPELVPFNGWRQKLFMDNPDFRYWVADVAPGGRYRVTGHPGDAVFVSITAYAAQGGIEATAGSRLDSDSLAFGADGSFDLVVAPERPDGDRAWLPLPEGASVLWVRCFHATSNPRREGWCRIEPLDPPPPAPWLDSPRFAHQLGEQGGAMSVVPSVWSAAAAAEAGTPNELRRWDEMSGGAAFTEPGIEYLRGSWRLEPGEVLVIEGPVTACRYWNVLLYNRFLNSLDHRHRKVSATSATATVTDGRYRFVLAAEDPGGTGDWLDTEGRPFGIVVLRWLHPEGEVEVPTTRVVRGAELTS